MASQPTSNPTEASSSSPTAASAAAPPPTSSSDSPPTAVPLSTSRTRTSTDASATKNQSILERFQNSAPPSGMWSATGEVAAKAPTLRDIRRGSFSRDGWSAEGQQEEHRRRGSSVSDTSGRRLARTPTPQSPGVARTKTASSAAFQDLAETSVEHEPAVVHSAGQETSTVDPTAAAKAPTSSHTTSTDSRPAVHPTTYPNGYQFPPKHTWGEATSIALRASVKFVLTPLGFLITLYGLNVVAWGGMLFLLLCNASPAMCAATGGDCNAINSPRRIWIEIDSQILNALFCVTGFGLIPWRFRDLYYLLKWRVGKRETALRRLAGIHNGWFRLPGSEKLDPNLAPTTETFPSQEDDLATNPAVPVPVSKTPSPPLTGVRSPPSKLWKLDFVIWMFVANTFLQAVLSGFMWGLNRIDRPSWSTGTFVALACIVAAAAGFVQFREGKKIKNVEGVPVSEDDLERLRLKSAVGDGDVEKGLVESTVGTAVVRANTEVTEKQKRKWYQPGEADRKKAKLLQRWF